MTASTGPLDDDPGDGLEEDRLLEDCFFDPGLSYPDLDFLED